MLQPYILHDGVLAQVRNKGLLLDSDFLITINKCGAEPLIDELVRNRTQLYVTHPVILEILNTNNSIERASLAQLITIRVAAGQIVKHPLTQNDFDFAEKIQASIPNAQPSVADFYCGCLLTKTDMYLITANIKDFPFPLFKREGYLTVQTNTSSKLFALIAIDVTQVA
jgi:predicted nucleic acid-binding protein